MSLLISKAIRIESQDMRDAANGMPCTLNIAGVCLHTTDTTVLCHFPDESHGGSRKSDDISAGFGCAACHDVIDGRRKHNFAPGEKDWYLRRAQVRTLRILIGMGVIKIKGVRA